MLYRPGLIWAVYCDNSADHNLPPSTAHVTIECCTYMAGMEESPRQSGLFFGLVVVLSKNSGVFGLIILLQYDVKSWLD